MMVDAVSLDSNSDSEGQGRVRGQGEGQGEDWERLSPTPRNYHRTNARQFQIMLAFMEKHGEPGVVRWSPRARLDRWEQLGRELDAAGDGQPPRSPSRWRRVWADLKNNTKRKVMKTREGTSSAPLRLTPTEFRLLKLIGMIKPKKPASVDVQAAPNEPPPVEPVDVRIRPVPLTELQPEVEEPATSWQLQTQAKQVASWQFEMEAEVEAGAEFADCSNSAPSPPAPPPPSLPPDQQEHTTGRGLGPSSCTAEQLEALLAQLARAPALARGQLRSAAGRARARALWAHITASLNALPGGSVKTATQWQKVWTDKKYFAKKNAAAARAGGAALGPWDQRLLHIAGERVTRGTARRSAAQECEMSDPLSSPQEECPSPPRASCAPSAPRAHSPGEARPRPRRGVAGGCGGACSRALAALARALTAANARGEQELRLRRAELGVRRRWLALAERGLRLLETWQDTQRD